MFTINFSNDFDPIEQKLFLTDLSKKFYNTLDIRGYDVNTINYLRKDIELFISKTIDFFAITFKEKIFLDFAYFFILIYGIKGIECISNICKIYNHSLYNHNNLIFSNIVQKIIMAIPQMNSNIINPVNNSLKPVDIANNLIVYDKNMIDHINKQILIFGQEHAQNIMNILYKKITSPSIINSIKKKESIEIPPINLKIIKDYFNTIINVKNKNIITLIQHMIENYM